MSKPEAWSHTRLDSFENCPKAFKEVSILKKYPFIDTVETKWGRDVHKQFEHFLLYGSPLQADLAMHQEFLQRFIGAIGQCPGDVQTRMFLGAGPPEDEILRYARDLAPDLLALVWHGDLHDQHGKVFSRVLRAAPCPVLVLKR